MAGVEHTAQEYTEPLGDGCFDGDELIDQGEFDECAAEPTVPEWCEEWGDEQEFLEKFRDAPMSEMSGSELIMLNIAIERDTMRHQARLAEALRDMF